MLNCQPEQLLQTIFMLMTENTRLNNILAESKPTTSVMERITLIQGQLNKELQLKDKKLQQLYVKIRTLHNSNNELTQKYNKSTATILQLEQQYRNQISEYKAKELLTQKHHSISQQNHQLYQKNISLQSQLQTTKIQFNQKNAQCQQLKSQLNEKTHSYSKLEQLIKTTKTQLLRKTQKLKDYDQKYNTYTHKMTALSSQCKKLRQHNKTLTENNKQLQQTLNNSQNFSKQQKIQFQALTSQVKILNEEIRDWKFALQQQKQQKQILINEKNQAIKHWEQALEEMGKQKTIIHSLQQQLQSHRKNRLTESVVKKIVTEMQEVNHKQTQVQTQSDYSFQMPSFQKKSKVYTSNQTTLEQIERQYERSKTIESSCVSCHECVRPPTSASRNNSLKKYDYLKVRPNSNEKQNKPIRYQSHRSLKKYQYESGQSQMVRITSDKRFTHHPQSQRLKTYGTDNQYEDQKQILVEKMDKINSWRNEPISKGLHYYKRMNPGRISTMQSGRKEDMNQIIKRKCQYILDK